MSNKIINKFASAKTYIETCDKYFLFVFIPSIVLIIAGWYWGIFIAPPDAVQGDSYRIIYLHVPSSIYAQLIYWIMAAWSAIYLIWKVKLAAYLTKSAAYVGLLVTFLALFSGSVWGIPTWGTWWQWDARITSTLILFLMYLGLIALHDSFNNQNKADNLMSILTIVGCVNLPIIKKSVDWWSTLHQPASITLSDNPAIDPAMLYPLILCIVSFGFVLISMGVLVSKIIIFNREKNRNWVKSYG